MFIGEIVCKGKKTTDIEYKDYSFVLTENNKTEKADGIFIDNLMNFLLDATVSDTTIKNSDDKSTITVSFNLNNDDVQINIIGEGTTTECAVMNLMNNILVIMMAGRRSEILDHIITEEEMI